MWGSIVPIITLLVLINVPLKNTKTLSKNVHSNSIVSKEEEEVILSWVALIKSKIGLKHLQ